MTAQYLLDTDTFSAIVKGQNPTILRRLETLNVGQAALSAVTRGEIAYGVRHMLPKPRTLQRINALLESFPTLELSAEVAHQYGELRAHLRTRGTPIGPNDLWIAAHALTNQYTLVTNNVGEFSRIPGIKLENWGKA